jgi:hypothetical protein
MKRSYQIHSRPCHLDGGWNLKLLEDGQEAGGGEFPVRRMIHMTVWPGGMR